MARVAVARRAGRPSRLATRGGGRIRRLPRGLRAREPGRQRDVPGRRALVPVRLRGLCAPRWAGSGGSTRRTPWKPAGDRLRPVRPATEEKTVEIKDYLKVLGKRAWLLVMIPAVAGVVAGPHRRPPAPGLPDHGHAAAAARRARRRRRRWRSWWPTSRRRGQQPDRAEQGVRRTPGVPVKRSSR